MDLSKLDTTERANKGAWTTVVDIGTGKETDARILLAGVDSEQFKEAKEKWENKRRAKLEKGAGLPTSQELDQARLETLVACTLDWENVDVDGNSLSCNRSQIIYVYKRFPWLREQVDQFIGDRRNFLPEDERETHSDPIPEPEYQALSNPDAYAAHAGKE